ncbi:MULTISPECIES: DUF6186 family protein [unclassified Geodermatophilus]|uniref:DUF6186 family protein n=1 Tax=unclassified Geodermatophilus TaxID=2637632 RepID=UPI003EEE9EF5
MSGTVLSLAGFALLAVAGVWLAGAGRRSAGHVTAAEAVAAAMRTLPGRLAVLAAWLWLGVHFLAR